MSLKQANATDDTTVVIESIIKNFQAIKMQQMAKEELYLGIPFTTLDNFHQALCEQIVADEKTKFLNRLRYTGIYKERTEDTFKWDKNTYPLVPEGTIEKVLSIEFVTQRKGLIVAGPPGTGKSLLVTIVACKALRAGFSVLYKTAHDIATALREAKSGNSLTGYIKKLQARDLLIIEDVTYATFDKSTAQAFFSIMDKRYGRKTTIITANGNISEWAANFPNQSMSTAMLGRFYENALLINMNGAKDMRLSKAKAFFNENDNNTT